MTKLLLVRHGITEYNATRRFAGYSDVELSQDGQQQAARLRDRLAGEKIDAIYSSDLKRALATARIISDGCPADIITCSELREMNYGVAEGLTFDEIKQRYPELAGLISNFNLELEFPDGESFQGFIQRTVAFLDKLARREPSETVLIVSHSGPLRVLVCHLLGIAQTHWRQIGCANASLSVVETYPQLTIISTLNDTSHLRSL